MDLNQIQGLDKTTTKIQDFFKILRTVERVLAVRTCEKNVGGGGGGGELGQRWLVAISKWKIRI